MFALILMAILNFTHGKIYNDKIEIIDDYVKFNHIKSVTIVLNWRSYDVLKVQKSLQDNGIRSRILHPEIKQDVTFRDMFHVTVTDFSCDICLDNLIKVTGNNPLDVTNKWLIFTDDLQKLRNNSNNLPLRVDSDVTVVYVKHDQAILYDAYKSAPTSQLKLIQIRQWRNDTITSLLHKYDMRRNLEGTTLSVVTILQSKIMHSFEENLKDYQNKHQDNVAKMNYDLLLLLQQMHNFSIKLIVLNDEEELTDFLKDNKAEIAGTAGGLTHGIIKSLDILTSTYRYRSAFIFRNPGNILGRNEFLEPMGSDVWYATLGSTIFVIVLLRIAFIADGRLNEGSSDYVKINCEEGKEWSAVICDTLSILIQQGTTYEPICSSGKIILFAYLTLTVLLFNYYSSIMVSNLLSSEPPKFRSLMELGSSKISMGMQNSSLIISSFETSSDAYVRYIYRNKIGLNGNTMDIAEGVPKLKEEMFAFYAHCDAAFSLIRNTFELTEICDINEISAFAPINLYVFAPKNSPYKKLFTISYRKLMERGAYKHIANKWLTPKNPCLAIRDLRQVNGEECLPLYNMLICGCILSVIFLILEIVIKSNMLRKLNRKAV